MKYLFCVLTLLATAGCTSVSIPSYIQDKNPYQHNFYASFDEVHEATVASLEELGWAVEGEANPGLYERGRAAQDSRRQTLIFTGIRQLPFVVGSGYSKLNVLLNVTADKATAVEIRYLKVTTLPLKTLRDYKNDKLANRLLKLIEDRLSVSQ